jgi:hypothetical protein
MNRKRVHGACEFVRKRRINQAVALDPALPFEGVGHDINTEMRLAAGPMAGMALVQVRFVLNLEAFRCESFAQLIGDSLSDVHPGGNTSIRFFRQWCVAR